MVILCNRTVCSLLEKDFYPCRVSLPALDESRPRNQIRTWLQGFSSPSRSRYDDSVLGNSAGGAAGGGDSSIADRLAGVPCDGVVETQWLADDGAEVAIDQVQGGKEYILNHVRA